jgi:hypothetical protein
MTQNGNTVNEDFLVEFAKRNGLTHDVARNLVGLMSPEDQQTALQAYAGAKRKEGKKDEIEFALTPILPDTIVHLSDIIYLDEVPIEDASEAMRSLNPDTVENYQAVYADTPDVMPAVKITGTTWGMLNLDGRHRLQAMENNLKARYLDANGKFANGGKESWVKARKAYVVKWEEVPCDDQMSAVAYAFRANMANGLSMGKNNRVRYALWLQRQAEKFNSSMTDRDAAKAAGLLGHTGLVNARTRLMKKIAMSIIDGESKGVARDKIKMPADYTLMPDTFDKQVTTEIKRLKKEPENKLEKPIEGLFKSILAIVDLLNDSEALATEFVEFFVNAENNVSATETIIDALQIAIDTALDREPDNDTANEQAEEFALAQAND